MFQNHLIYCPNCCHICFCQGYLALSRLPVKICWFFWQIEIICRFNLESLDSKKKGDICEVDPSYIWGCFEIWFQIRFVWMHLSLDAKATQIGFLSVFCPLATLHKTTSYSTWSVANNSEDSLKLFEICLQIEQSLWHLSECPFCQIPTSQLANLKNNFRKGLKKTQRNNFSLFSGSRFHLGS